MKLLLHTCCGPCACDLISRFQSENLLVVPFWYNPNIHPWTEYNKRLDAAHSMCRHYDLDMIGDDDYDLDLFMGSLAGSFDTPARCHRCYELRLDRTAQQARESGADAFSTSLLVSPRQNHELIKQIGEQCARNHNVRFMYQDFRPYYPQAVQKSKQLALYRQQYCGCIFSERDRYRPHNNRG